jgi:putative aldouronate transport system substrate-binding protein
MKKVTRFLFAAVVIAVGAVSAGASGATDAKAGEPRVLAIVMPGTESVSVRQLIDGELNKRLAQDIGVKLEVSYSPWNQYGQKTDLMLASGEKLDWFWRAAADIPRIAARKQIQPLNALLDEKGNDALKKAIPRKNYESFTVDGQIMAVPSQNASSASKFGGILLREDLRKAVGMGEIKTVADLTEYSKKIKEKYPQMIPFSGLEPTPALVREEKQQIQFFTMSLAYGAYIDENEGADRVYSFYESEAFKRMANQFRAWYQAGYVPEDALANRIWRNRMDTGKSAWGPGALTRDMENLGALRANVPDGVYREFLIAPDRPKYIYFAGNEGLMIPAYSKEAKTVMSFFNWIFTSQDNYDLLLYGVKGTHFSLEGDKIKPLTNDALFYEWMFRNKNFQRFPTTMDDAYAKKIKTWDDDAKYSKIFGFNFNEESLKSEIAQLLTVYTEAIMPIAWGFLDYETNYPAMQAKLKAAGIDKYTAELQKQYAAYRATRK